MRLYTFLPSYMSLEEFINSSPDRQAMQLVYLPYKDNVQGMIPIGSAEVTLNNDLRTAIDFAINMSDTRKKMVLMERASQDHLPSELNKLKDKLK